MWTVVGRLSKACLLTVADPHVDVGKLYRCDDPASATRGRGNKAKLIHQQYLLDRRRSGRGPNAHTGFQPLI